ncbi:unnamed protein product [Ostreobium quekettii]|uniref:Bystin n=1 Tax=Ostreobium quekettii TaxID=121088 RepID=A0A8S1J707_9CHLO|nr:unnamed protein product [Ostreobium quekettii]|eukprot:evm.model.scf_2997.1 EVM.evm.TU.scf_2997.1   scf_2997:2006-6897(+)
MPRRGPDGAGRAPRHKRSLTDQIQDPASHGVRVPKKRALANVDEDDVDDVMGTEVAVPADLSNAILREARAQRDEVEAEERAAAGGARLESEGALAGGALKAALEGFEDGGEDPDDDDGFDGDFADIEVDATEDDERALNAFLAPGHEDYRQETLADVILAKIREKQKMQGISTPQDEGDQQIPSGIDDKVVEMYTKVGEFMSRYKSGKVPKGFKIIPSLNNWEDVLFLTNPEGWSAHATLVGTISFVSNLNEQMAQRFLNLVVLPKIREDIRTHKRLHFALWQSLKKACYKPGAFYKGIILPLCMSGTCDLREAVIFTSVLKRASLPAIHSAAALLRLADMPYSGTTSFFIRTLIDKKYALPYKVIDGLVHHFLSFEQEERQLPVVWHHSLLAFIQRYKNDIKQEDKFALKRLMKAQCHYRVTPEIHRELDNAVRSRDGAVRPKGVRHERGVDGMDIDEKVTSMVPDNVRNMAPMLVMEDY